MVQHNSHNLICLAVEHRHRILILICHKIFHNQPLVIGTLFIIWHHPVSILKYMYMFNARSIVSHVHYLYGGADCQGDAVQILACNRDPCNGRVEINITHLSQRFGEEPGNKSFIVALTLNL